MPGKHRDAWYAAGNRPYALKLRDTQVPIERLLGPLAVPLVFGAALMDSYLANGREVDPAMLAEFANSAQREWFDASGLRAFHDVLANTRNGLFNRGFPTILIVTSDKSAEDQIARAAVAAAVGREPTLPLLLTCEWRIDDPRNPQGLLGPIWREALSTRTVANASVAAVWDTTYSAK